MRGGHDRPENGNSMKHWFFATSRAEGDTPGLPHCPCSHRHRTLDEAKTCASRRGNTHVREVYEGAAIKDHGVR